MKLRPDADTTCTIVRNRGTDNFAGVVAGHFLQVLGDC